MEKELQLSYVMTEEERKDFFPETPLPRYYGIRFHTFHVVNREGKEIGQIIAAVIKERERFSMACSFCSPRDQFNREFGRFIAYRRLMFSPRNRGSSVSFTSVPGVKVTTLIKHNCLVLAAHYPVRWVLREVDSIDQLK